MLRQFAFVALCLLLLLGYLFRVGLCGLRQCADGVAGGTAANDDDWDTFVGLVNNAPQCRPNESDEIESRDAERELDGHAQRMKRPSLVSSPSLVLAVIPIVTRLNGARMHLHDLKLPINAAKAESHYRSYVRSNRDQFFFLS